MKLFSYSWFFKSPILQVENEENVLVALRIIIELHKQYRPQMPPEVDIIFKNQLIFKFM